jgi:hypothetical protein
MRRPQSGLRAFAAAAIAGAVVAASPLASISSASAAVYSPQQALPATTIQQFLADPAALLAQYPNGADLTNLTKEVRDLAASDPQTLNALIGLLATANPDQASAIGKGLGQAAEMAINSDPAYAGQIQTAIIGARSNPALVAFSAIVGGDIKLAAATGGVGPGGSGEAPTGSSAPLGGVSSSLPLNFPSSANNTADSFPGSNFTPGTPGSSVSASVP